MTTTDTLGFVKVSGQKYVVFLNGATDGSATEIKIYTEDGATVSLGEKLYGETLEEILLQCTDGSILTNAILYDDAGGKVMSWRGGERHYDDVANLFVRGLRLPLTRSMTIKINTGD